MKGRGRRKRRISEHNRATYERLSTSLVRQTMKAWAKLGDTQTQNAQIQLACQLCCGSICSYFLLPWYYTTHMHIRGCIFHARYVCTFSLHIFEVSLYWVPNEGLQHSGPTCLQKQPPAQPFQTSSWSFALTGSRPVRLKLSCLHR